MKKHALNNKTICVLLKLKIHLEDKKVKDREKTIELICMLHSSRREDVFR